MQQLRSKGQGDVRSRRAEERHRRIQPWESAPVSPSGAFPEQEHERGHLIERESEWVLECAITAVLLQERGEREP